MYKSYIYRIIFILFLFISVSAIAQETLTSSIVETRSYQLYMDKNWKELKTYGNNAIQKGFDTYYLRVRIGIAYYEQKNYAIATKHFQKALAFNSDDALAKEYLYYCYVFTERYDDAMVLSKKFDDVLAEKIGTNKQSSLSFVQLEGGIKISDKANYPHLSNHDDNTHQNDQRNDTSIYKNITYLQLGMGHTIKNRISLFHAVTYFNQENSHSNYETFSSNTQNTPISGNDTTRLKVSDKTKQWQYYLSANVPLKHNWSISPAFHFINKNGTSSRDTSSFVKHPNNPQGGSVPEATTSESTTATSKESYYVGSFSIQKIIDRVSLSIGTTYSYGTSKVTTSRLAPGGPGVGPPHQVTTTASLLPTTLFQNNLSLEYAILGNKKLVLGCVGYVNYSSKSNAIAPYVIVRPTKNISLILSYLTNSGDNIIEANGYLINNSTDNTVSRYSFNASFAIGKHIDLYGLYFYENKVESLQSFNYNYNGYFAGIRIKNFTKFANPKN